MSPHSLPHRRRLALAPLLLCPLLCWGAGCSDDSTAADAGPTPDRGAADRGAVDLGPPDGAALPATIQVSSGQTTLRLGTDPLSLSLSRGAAELSRASAASATDAFAPVSLGLATGYQQNLFYDPAAPLSSVSFAAAARATAVSKKGSGYRVTLSSGQTLELQPGAQSGTVRLTLSGKKPDPKGSAPQPVHGRLCLGVAADEVFFGFGELLDTVSSRGVVRPMQLLVDQSIDSGLNEVHVPVPLAISPRGWAMMVRDFHPGAFDVAKGKSDRICATFNSAEMVVDLFTAQKPLSLVEAAVAATAKPALPPAWAFGPHQWRNALSSQAELLQDAAEMRTHKIPNSVIWIDNPWQTGYNSFLFDQKQFPDAAGAIKKLHALGYKVLLWSTPYVNQDQTAQFAEAKGKGYLATDSLGNPLVYKWANGRGGLLDFGAPGARAFWQGYIKRVTDLGVNGFKLDYGEDMIPALGPVKNLHHFYGGKTAATMHREYPGLYHEAYLSALPAGEGFLITRAGSLGEQKVNTCIWPGDLDNTFQTHAEGRVGGLPAAISAGLSLSASGYPFFGSDIGGFRKGAPTAELLQRWAEYAALGTIMQLGGGGKHHNPWDASTYGAAAAGLYRTYARLHTDIFPTLYTYARQAAQTGRPVTRPLGLAFAEDKKTWTRDFQYMFGEYLLVAPVITAGATSRTLYLPKGSWVHHFSRKAYSGPAKVTVPAPLGQLPLFWREGAVVAWLAEEVDTLAPAGDAAVVSYQQHKDKLLGELLLDSSGSAGPFALFDGTKLGAGATSSAVTLQVTPGSQFNKVRLKVDWQLFAGAPKTPGAVTDAAGKALSQATSAAATRSCSGCWYFDAAQKTLHVGLGSAVGSVTVK